MFFFLALLFSACLAVAADWNDFATEPSQVQADGKSFYEITSASELAWFSKQVASGKNDINAILGNDIALWDSVSGDTNYWSPIGPSDSLAFEGVFDGNGKTIFGVHSIYSLENVDSVFNGFFRFVGENGVVKNFTLEKSIIQVEFLGSDIVTSLESFAKNPPFFYSVAGCVAGKNRGLIDSVRIIDSEAIAKGNSSSKVVSTTPTAMVNAYMVEYFVGGVAGLNEGSVTRAYVNGLAVPSHGSMENAYIGGIVGANVGTVSQSRVEGDLKDDLPSLLGGICGKNEGTLDHVKMVGDMETVTGFVAGIVAENRGLVEWAEYTGSLGRAGDGGVTIGGIAAHNLGKISKSFYGFVDSTKTLRLSANLTVPMSLEMSPQAFAGGIVARQSEDGIVEDCGVRVSWIVLGTKSSKTGSMYTGGHVGSDSGSVYNSYAAFYKISEAGNKAPLYDVVPGGAHEGNHYDSVQMETPFPGDTTGLEQSLMKSPRFAWMLNTKYQTVANRNIWCHNGSYPVLALDGREPTYGIVRYLNDVVFDTIYTDCDGHAVWGDSIPDPATGKMIGDWKLKGASATQNVGQQYVFSSDTSICAYVEISSSSAQSSSAMSSSAKSSSGKSSSGKSSSSTEQIHMTASQMVLKYSVERGWIYLEGLTFAAPVALFDIQGNLVKRAMPSENRLAISLECSGMYILRYKGTSFKVFVP